MASEVKERINDAYLLIIDEISTIKPETLAQLNTIFQQVRKSNDIFGGCKLLLVRDFYKLPPVNNDNNFYQLLFQCELFKKCEFKIIELKDNFRQQTDSEILKHLNAVRIANFTKNNIDYFLQKRTDTDIFDNNIPRIFFTNNEKDIYNFKQTNLLPGELYTVAATTKYFTRMPNEWQFSMPPESSFKIGAQIMIIMNIKDLNIVNGDIGNIIDYDKKEMVLIIKMERIKETVKLKRLKEDLTDSNNKVIASCTGFPIIQAYGFTAHKEQRITLKEIVVHIPKPYHHTPHLFYVAISRVQTGKNLHIIAKENIFVKFLNDMFTVYSVSNFYNNIGNDNIPSKKMKLV